MGSIGRIISTTIDNYIISVIEKRLGFKVESYHFAPSGDDSPPLPKDKVFTAKKDGTGKYVVLGNLMISQGASAGEKILYSRDSEGVIKSKLYLKNDGSFIFNDGSNEAARNGDQVKVTIPPNTFLVAAQAGVPNPTAIEVTGTIQEGTSEVLLP